MTAMVTVYIATPPGYVHSQAFTEVAEGLCMAFAELGYDANLTFETHNWEGRLIVLGTRLLTAVPNLALPNDALLFNMEPITPGAPWLDPQLLEIYKHFKVLDYSVKNVKRLTGMGIDAVYMGIGSMRGLRRIPNDADEDIDVLFYGSINERRKRILEGLIERGAVVKTLFGCYGYERDTYIARAKIVLNIHYYDIPFLEIMRLHYLLNNRRFIVSEDGADAKIEEALSSGILFAPYEGLVDRCMEYLKNPEGRLYMAANGYQLFRRPSQADLITPHLETLFGNASAPGSG